MSFCRIIIKIYQCIVDQLISKIAVCHLRAIPFYSRIYIIGSLFLLLLI